ncbi:MAG: HEAT repeat domain-containing protein [Myxococcota bacterium]
MRQLAVPLLLVLGLADVGEAEPRRARKTPSQSALGNPKEDDAALPPAPAPFIDASRTEADVALVRALLWAFEPAPLEIRLLAVEDLALLGDVRALNPLAQLVFDPHPSVQAAALRAVTRFQHRRAEEILCNAVQHPHVSERLKTQALEALLFQRSASARAFLSQVAGSSRHGYSLRNTAQRVLAQWGAT